eukprot:5032388-Prymnesium_polylepis.1
MGLFVQLVHARPPQPAQEPPGRPVIRREDDGRDAAAHQPDRVDVPVPVAEVQGRGVPHGQGRAWRVQDPPAPRRRTPSQPTRPADGYALRRAPRSAD